jgi:hypothetical protein
MTKAPDGPRFLVVVGVRVCLIALCLAGPSVPAGAAGLDARAAALQNRQGLTDLVIGAFHRVDRGWEIYAPLVAHEIGVGAGPDTPAFAQALASWQSARGLGASGVMDAATFGAMNMAWLNRRPFVAASRRLCPAPPAAAFLSPVPAAASYGGKMMLLRPAALAAYARMAAAARAEAPALSQDSRLMTVFSAYRAPDEDAARCLRDGDCQGVARAVCSAHATGLAIDLFLGAAPGFGPDSSEDANRLYLSRGAAYRWLVDNAGRFGFTPYAFEPWHWEWTGEPI